MTTYIPYHCNVCNREIWKRGICRHCSGNISAFVFMAWGAILLAVIFFVGCASVKAPKTHVFKVENQIDMRMTLGELEAIRPVVYYKSKTLGIEFYETQHLTMFGKIPFVTKQTTAYKDTIRAMPCYFRVRASKDGKKWSGWSKEILVR